MSISPNPTGVRHFFSFSVRAHFLSRAIAQKALFGLFMYSTSNFNHYICVLVLNVQTFLVTPSLTCSFAAKLPSLFPTTSSPSRLVAQLVEQRWSVSVSWNRIPPGSEIFTFSRGSFPFSGYRSKGIIWVCVQPFTLPDVNHYIPNLYCIYKSDIIPWLNACLSALIFDWLPLSL